MRFEDKVCVVTGASRGIGKAIALALAREGAHVVVMARSSEESPTKLPGTIEETARLIQGMGRRALAVPCNVADEAQVEELARRTLEEFGRVDILINNAGVSYPAPFLETPIRRWDLVMNVNLRGTVLCSMAFLPRMVEQGQGKIINVSSGAVNAEMAAQVGLLSYSVAKAAIEQLTRGLAVELAPKGVAVNCLRIDMSVVTEGWTYLNPHRDYSDWEKPETVADATLWLAAQDTSFTGRVLSVTEIVQRLQQGSS
ncbi:MAG: SDR family NAD(P)-dependent oxidoreductase [Dehalococcoidia bacterium]|nr:SDR family NAD(P)-dependent oxidoreductase [Dehalococcoidia bacterium]MDW8008898.1 SDR family NAD(P)-dependent oxidoreductase [Chloroflexota bacterium]